MIKEKDAGVEAVVVEAMIIDATPKRQRTDDHQARAAADAAPEAHTLKSWPARAPTTVPEPEHRNGW